MVILNSASTISNSSTVSDAHFGLNYLVHIDAGTAETDVFANIASNQHETSSIRFPGGTVAEIGAGAEPALDISVNNGTSADELAATTLDFLDHADANDWSVTFVLPMWRFLDQDTKEIADGAVSEITEYVAAVLAAAEARGVTIDGFELGNEWDVLTGKTSDETLSRAETDAFFTAYANLAADLAVAVQDEIDDTGLYTALTEPFIAIQAMRAWANNTWYKALDYIDALEDAFTDGSGNTNTAGDAVDSIIAHYYLSQPGFNGEVADPELGFVFDNINDVDAVFGGDLDYLISEWNLKGKMPLFIDDDGKTVIGLPDKDQNMGDGIQQLEPIVGLFHTLISEGVDYANFWAVRETAWSSLYGSEIVNGMPVYERPVRYIFDLLSDQLIGANAIDLNGGAEGSKATIGTDINVYGFQDTDSNTTLYFGSRSDTAQSINLDLGNYATSSDNPLVQVTRISVDDPTLKSYLQQTTVVTQEFTFNQFQALSGDFLQFSAYELISIEIIYDAGPGETEHGTDIQDLMFGTAADDIFTGSVGADEIFGYFGSDTIDYSDSTSNVLVYLNTAYGTNSGGYAAGDVLTSIENITGSAHDDTIIGATENNVLKGLDGNDLLDGKWGNDTLFGGAGNDTLYGGAGNDKVYSGSGTDTVYLGDGNDYVKVGGGQEHFDGGTGKDYISYYDSTGGVTINLETNAASGSWASNDTITGFESVSGSKTGDDKIYGTTGSNTIKTYGGNDKVYAGKGTDKVYLGDGDDYVLVGDGKGNFYGGDGVDYISYYHSIGGVTIDLENNTVSGSWASDDIIEGFEEASGSKVGADKMTGTSGSNRLKSYGGDDKLYGRGGDDKLYGGDGDDRFDGGAGTDELYGGAGADIFHFDHGEDHDIIKDFENNIDVIQLDNFTFAAGQDAFDFATQSGADVIFDFGGGDVLTVENATIGQLTNDLIMV